MGELGHYSLKPAFFTGGLLTQEYRRVRHGEPMASQVAVDTTSEQRLKQKQGIRFRESLLLE